MKFRERPAIVLISDAAVSAVVGGAAGWGMNAIFHVSAVVAAALAGIVFARIFTSLRKHAPDPFHLPKFATSPLEFEADELLLDDVVAAYERDSRVVPIFAGAKPAELRARIERHLSAHPAQQQEQGRSASEELADALAELRRSLR